jgi:hypothetical protein
MITRRSVLGMFAQAPFAVCGFGRKETRRYHRDYYIFFTGWKSCMNSDFQVGQWIGWPVYPNGDREYRRDNKYPFLVASVPGQSAAYAKGATFDISIYPNQKPIHFAKTPEQDKEVESLKGKKRLIAMIDCVLDSGKENLEIWDWDEILDKKGLKEIYASL